MKLIILLFLLFSSAISIAKPLQCSAHGTDVYYINGVLTNKQKNTDDTGAIQELFKGKNYLLDSGPLISDKSPVKFIGIHNPSFGLVNDSAELFAQSYYAKTGSNENAKAIFNLIQNIPEKVGLIASAYSPSIISTAVNFFGYSRALNLATLQSVAEEDIQTSLKRSLASTETLLPENQIITNSIANAVIKSKQDKRKILFVAHSQGNAALVAGIKKLTMANVNSEVDYMKKYMGAFHVASPVQPLSKTGFKSKDIRTKQDYVIEFADFFSRNFIPVEFQIKPANVTHEVITRSLLPDEYPDSSGHLFFNTYLSDAVIVRSFASNGISGKMSDVFTNTLSDLATELEGNCLNAIIEHRSESLNVTFDSTDPQNPDAIGLTYLWNFGDGQGQITTSKTISHTYAELGNYNVTLTVTDINGESSFSQKSILVPSDGVTFCNVDTRGVALTFSISGLSESFTLVNQRTDDFINDPIDCACRTLDLQPLQTYHVTVTSSDITCLTNTNGVCMPYPILPFEEDITINAILNPFIYKFNFDATPSLPYGTFSVVRGGTTNYCKSLINK